MLQVLRSSAGAGKTHALVKRFAGLALAGESPHAYRHILALTFTNKAAAEMKERVLLYLRLMNAPGAEDARITDLLDHLLTEHGTPPELARKRAARVLAHMAHHWSDLSITTIDAFVRRLVRPFTRDLHLDQDLRMTTEQHWYQHQAMEHLLALAGRDAALTQVLVATCAVLVDEEKSWDPQPAFAHLAKQLDRESADEHLQRLHHLEARDLLRIQRELHFRIEEDRDRVRRPARELLQRLRASGVGAADMAHTNKGPWGFLERMTRFEGDLGATTTVSNVLASGKWFSGKADVHAQQAIEAHRYALEEFLRTVLGMPAEQLRTLLLRAAILDGLLPLGALAAMEQALRAVKKADGVTFFQDLTRSVALLVAEEPVPFIYERLGMRYRHFLIDEFQDTSVMQWHALLPLVENALSERGSVFVVGDAKQAIYRWRNGEVRQFQALPGLHRPDRLPDGVRRAEALRMAYRDIQPLADNYRSAPEVIAFNNGLFERLRQLLPRDYRSIYDGLEQQARKHDHGLVTLRNTTNAENEEEEVMAHLLGWVEEVLADGFGPGDIAVLVRGAKQSAIVAKTLTGAGHPVISPEGLRLSGDASVEFIIQTLRFQFQGGEQQAVTALRAAMRAGVLPNDPLLFAEGAILLTSPANMLHGMLRDHDLWEPAPSLFAHVVSLLHAFGLDPAQDAFLATLLDQVRAYITAHGHDPRGFLDHMERVGAERGVALPEDIPAIRILTIHKSKGLQFPVVMLPWVDLRGRGAKRDHLWIDPGPAVPDLPAAMIKPSKVLAEAGVPEVVEEQELEDLDVLNLLYVAFTRPEMRLYGLVDGGSRDPYVTAIRDHWMQLKKDEDDRYGVREQARITNSNTPAPAPPPCAPPSRTTVPRFRSGAPEQWDPADPDQWRRSGELIHGLLATIRQVNDLNGAIDDLVRRGAFEPGEAEHWRTLLRSLLDRPDIRPWFSGDGKVIAEQTLITADGHALRPDRILHHHGRWRVMDIKTGLPRDSHHAQVERYCELLHAITGGPVDGMLLYLRDGQCIDIPWRN